MAEYQPPQDRRTVPLSYRSRYLKKTTNTLLPLLIGGVCILVAYVVGFSPLRSKPDVEQLFSDNREDFELIASYMMNNPALIFPIEPGGGRSRELETALQNVSGEKCSVVGIFHDLKYPGVLHFPFPSVYEGRDSENTDIWIRRELVYSESPLPSTIDAELVSPNGIYYYDEQVGIIEGSWYVGSYRVY